MKSVLNHPAREFSSLLFCHSVSWRLCLFRQGLRCGARCSTASSAASPVVTLVRVDSCHLYSVPRLLFICIKGKLCGWSIFKSCWWSQDLLRVRSLCPIWHWARRMPKFAIGRASKKPSCRTLLEASPPWAEIMALLLLRWSNREGQGHTWQSDTCLTFSFEQFLLCIWTKGQVVWCMRRWRELLSFFLKNFIFHLTLCFLDKQAFLCSGFYLGLYPGHKMKDFYSRGFCLRPLFWPFSHFSLYAASPSCVKHCDLSLCTVEPGCSRKQIPAVPVFKQ